MQAKPASPFRLNLGGSARWSLPAETEVTTVLDTSLPAIDSIELAVVSALESPVDAPAFDEAILPGDRVAVAVDPAVPSLTEVVSRVASWLCERGVDPKNLAVVLAPSAAPVGKTLADSLRQSVSPDIETVGHDPDDREAIAYLGANEAAEAIYVNRTLVDADVVLPITCVRHKTAIDYFGAYGLFPLLSDRMTRGKFYRLKQLVRPQGQAEFVKWSDEAAWQLGLLVGLQVIPAGGDRIADILSGSMASLESASQESMARHWDTASVPPSQLVVALIDSAPSQQTWHDVARVLHRATRAVAPGGSIAVCSSLTAPIGTGLRRLHSTHREPEQILRKLDSDTSDDALSASLILQATQDYHIYLASNLPNTAVESLSVGVIENEQQLARLIGQHSSSALIGSAQHRIW